MTGDVWQQFLDNRADMLRQLGEQVLDGVARMDRPHHPAFHGSFDWHSNIHACYALAVLHRLTGEQKYLDAVNDVLDPAKLAEEVALLDQNRVTPDIRADRQYAWFYGYSWLLQLADTYEGITGDTRLRPLAEKAAEKLGRHIFTLPPDEITTNLADPEYRNLSWKVLNLWQWSKRAGDEYLMRRLEDFARAHMREPLRADDTKSFFVPSLMRAHAVISMLPSTDCASLLADIPEFVPYADAPEKPAHMAGMNFSAAWGLWSLYEATGYETFRDSYAAHISAQFNARARWDSMPDGMFDRAAYDRCGHWVPQFGIRAIARSFENIPHPE